MARFIKLYRGWEDSDQFHHNDSYCQRAAWIWLLSNAAWKNTRMAGPDGNQITVRPGQYVTSMRKLGKHWAWDKNKVSRYLQRLSNEKSINLVSGRHGVLITVKNWDKYQEKPPEQLTG